MLKNIHPLHVYGLQKMKQEPKRLHITGLRRILEQMSPNWYLKLCILIWYSSPIKIDKIIVYWLKLIQRYFYLVDYFTYLLNLYKRLLNIKQTNNLIILTLTLINCEQKIVYAAIILTNRWFHKEFGTISFIISFYNAC